MSVTRCTTEMKFQPVSYVLARNKDRPDEIVEVPVKSITYLDISEDQYGNDVITFEYDGTTQKSCVFLKLV